MRIHQQIHRAVAVGLMLCTANVQVQAAWTQSGDDFDTVEGLIRSLYNIVTFEAGTTPDWDVARAMFLPEALVVMRMSETETAVLKVEGWINDFISFIENRNVEETGFSETIMNMKTTQMGDIAHVLVLYESHLPGMPKRRGVDSFQLIRREGRWWILSIANELPRWGHKIPDELLPGSQP